MISSDLNKNSEINRHTIPWDVSVTKNPDDETFEQIADTQRKFLQLSEESKNILVSNRTGEKIQQIGNAFTLSLFQLADIARVVRSYYFGELKLEDMPRVLAREIPIDMQKAQEISRMVIEKIINDKAVEQTAQAKLVQMTVFDALKAYPEVGEQLITSEKIVLKNFPDPVRPCIKNWLADYNFTLGLEKHTTMDRGIYLFQSANGKRLSSPNRNRLAYILKAFDEALPVTVNKDSKQIVFAPSPPTPNPSPSSGPINIGPSSPSREMGIPGAEIHSNVQFSSAQKLPYERNQSQPYIIRPVTPKPEENKPVPKNVVNLKDI